MSKLFVAYYEPGYSDENKLVLTRAHKRLKAKYPDFIACEDGGTGSVEYLIDGGIVSTSSTPRYITLIHSSREGLEQLARELDLPLPSPRNLPRLNFNYSDHADGSPSCLDIHQRDKR